MNSGLLGSFALIGYAIYTFLNAKNGGADLNQALYAKVGIAGLAGSIGSLYNLKDTIPNFLKTLHVPVPVNPKISPVESLNLTELETQDNYCLNYLMKRISKDKKENPESPENGDNLMKELVAVFYEIHKREAVKE